jgi:chromosome segregation ATPase
VSTVSASPAAPRRTSNDEHRSGANVASMIDPAPVSPRRSAAKAAQAAAAIARAADGATEELAVLQAEIETRDAEIGRLLETCDDRQKVIADLGEQAAAYRRAAEGRAALAAALDFDVQRLRRDLECAEAERNDALAAAELATHALDDERRRATLAAHEHAAALRAARGETEALRTRTEMLDAALAARAGLIEELQAACDERLAAAEVAARALRAAQLEAEALRSHVDVLDTTLAARARLIEELQSACDERLAAVENLSQEVDSLRLIAEERRQLLEANDAAYRARDVRHATQAGAAADDGVDWRALADERERALQALGAEAERRVVLLAEVTAALEGRTREVEDLRQRLARIS